MDISKTDDIKELKSMAYDQLLTIENAQNNLKVINQRIAELQLEEKKEAKKAE
jgi:hypothetical protein